MKVRNILLVVVIVVLLVGCSTTTRMVQEDVYEKEQKKKIDVVLTFNNPEYELLVYIPEILIPDKILFIPSLKEFKKYMSDKPILLENVKQGRKVVYVRLIPKVVKRKILSEERKKRWESSLAKEEWKVYYINFFPAKEKINITYPKNTTVDMVVDFSNLIFGKSQDKEKSKKIRSPQEYLRVLEGG